MSLHVAGQLVGCAAVLFSLAAYQINRRRGLLLISTVSALLYSVAFWLLHAYTGSALNFLAAIRCYTFRSNATKHSSTKTFLIFGAASLAATLLTWNGLISLLPLAGTLLYAFSESQIPTRSLRRTGFLAPPVWFLYNLFTGFYPGMFVEVFVLISNMVGQYRFDLKQKKNRGKNRTMPQED
jgi:hypothetical protein